MKCLIAILLCFVSLHALADEGKVLPYPKGEFQPTLGQTFKIPLSVAVKSKVVIDINSPDGDVIRSLKSSEELEPGEHVLLWDGKDNKGNVVPDEAWYPIVTFIDGKGKLLSKVDPSETGGQFVEDLPVSITADKHISFQLPYPARVLARTGIKGGPMLKALSNWVPMNKGKVVIRWDGFDSDKLRDLRTHKGISFLAVAYRLPNHSIITSGNSHLSYREYKRKLGISGNVSSKKKVLEKGGERVAPHYYLPKDTALSPSVMLSFKEEYPQNENGAPVVDCPCDIRVDLAQEDKLQLQESLYEIAFFIDDEFISEQEQGYVPFTWRWSPSALEVGEHYLSVNVSGLRGEVGVKSLKFVVPETKQLE